MEFGTDCVSLKALLARYFYKSLEPLIKLWINEDGRKLFTWNDSVKKSSKAKTKAKIQNNYNLDLRYYWGKWQLKLMRGTHNKVPKKA